MEWIHVPMVGTPLMLHMVLGMRPLICEMEQCHPYHVELLCRLNELVHAKPWAWHLVLGDAE